MRGNISRRELGLLAFAVAVAPLRAAATSDRRSGVEAFSRALEVDELQTPALILDLDVFERNLEKMARFASSAGVSLRPHAKTHKCPEIARRQLELGAVGVCAAKISEAEVLVDAGIEGVLVTSPVATREKLERFVRLAARAGGLAIVVDHPDGVRELDKVARELGTPVTVFLGLDTGTRRTGIAPERALELARLIDEKQALELAGVQAYAGHVMHVVGHAERKRRSLESLEACLAARGTLLDAGIDVPAFSVGGTGTYDIDSKVEGVTDLQVGSYCFMDVQYRQIGGRSGDVFDDFEPSLFVLTTAISQPADDRITVDAGSKAMANERNARPEFVDREGLKYHFGGDEHGIVELATAARPLRRGEKARLLVSHCDPTVNLYDFIYPYREGQITERWRISARGRSQ